MPGRSKPPRRARALNSPPQPMSTGTSTSRISTLAARSTIYQNLRSHSEPLQGRQWGVGFFKDEVALEPTPCHSPLKTFTLYNQVGHQTQGNVMGLGLGLRISRFLGRPRVACLTALEVELTLQHPDHFFDFLAYPIKLAHLRGGQAQSVGRVVRAAVFHHPYLDLSRQKTHCLPIRLAQILVQRSPLKASILFKPAHKVPAVVAYPLQQRLGGIPRIKQHQLRLTFKPVTRITEQLQGQLKFGGATLLPYPKANGNTQLTIGPHQQHHRDPIDRFVTLARPYPPGLIQALGRGFLYHRIIHNEIASHNQKE